MNIPYVSDIKRFSVHDGNGIRTTVFFKGCPLKCAWCHNPESISLKPQVAYYNDKCINCEECVKICPNKAHKIINKNHVFDSELCLACGKCESVCLGGALRQYGVQYSVDELCEILLKDKKFYDSSNGGVTFSGGECLLYYEYCYRVAEKLKENNINIAIDTCGFVSKEAIDKIAEVADIFLYDIKAIDEDVHIKCTGQSNKAILENLRYIDFLKKDIEIRVPYVPGFNDNQMHKIYDFLKNIKHIKSVKVLPYHDYARNRYNALNLKYNTPKIMIDSEELNKIKELLEK